jgi:hypothetical protein
MYICVMLQVNIDQGFQALTVSKILMKIQKRFDGNKV